MPSATELLKPSALAALARDDAGRAWRRAWNGTRHLAGIGHPEVGQSPKQTVWRSGTAELWHYDRSTPATIAEPILLVMSLVSRSYVLDLRPGNSVVERLLADGFDVYLLDWGTPGEDDAHNTLETYVLDLLPRAVEATCEHAGADELTMWGYCFGGLLSVLCAAARPDLPVRSLLVMATPTDFTAMGPFASLLQRGRIEPDDLIDDTGNLPAATVRQSFKVLKPTADVASIVNLWQFLHDEDFLEAHQAINQWANDHIPFPGDAFRQTAELFLRDNLLVTGRVPLGGTTVDLRSITIPFANVVAEADHICPTDAVAPLTGLVGSADVTELRLRAGHVGLVVGKSAQQKHLPTMAAWVRAHSTPVGPRLVQA